MHSQAGFTIIESMVACVVLLVGLVATLSIVDQAASTTKVTRSREQATSLQREVVEGARSVSYDQLNQNSLGPAIRTRPGLGDASGSTGWTILRRSATYSVSVGVCTVDDPGDGLGAQEAGVYCAADAASPTDANQDGTVDGLASPTPRACTTPCDLNPADYKRIVSIVRWDGRTNVQNTQVNNPGLASAPAVTSLTAPGFSEPYAVTDTRPSLGLAVTWIGVPEVVALYLDGSMIDSIPKPLTSSWTTAWNMGPVTGPPTTLVPQPQPQAGEVVDGTYELSAKAFDQFKQNGATRAQNIVVNRRRHFAPARVQAGRNAGAVEIEWSPAKERDSEGFRVYRTTSDNPTPVRVCELAVRTACRDGAPPGPGRLPQYWVVGVDRNAAGVLLEGDPSAKDTVPDTPPALPANPTNLVASVVNGNPVLTWTAPAGPTPDHYNVYRGGSAYADRLDSVFFNPGDPLRYTDTRPPGQAEQYWITAVNENLGESAALGPVSP